MAITINEVQQFLETEKANPDVQKVLESLNPLDENRVKTILESELGKKVWTPIRDSAVTQGVETWKKNHLEKFQKEYFEAEYAKRHPAETEAEKRLRAVEETQRTQAQEAQRIKLENVALKLTKDEHLAALILADSEEQIKAKYEALTKVIEAEKAKMMSEYEKQGFTNPTKPNGQQNGKKDVFDDVWN